MAGIEPPLGRTRKRMQRLDHIPAWPALTLGAGFGLTAGALLAAAAPAAAGFALLLGLAARLALSGEPVAVPEPSRDEAEDPLWANLPGGRFRIGSPAGEPDRREHEGPVHEVDVSPFRCMRIGKRARLE